jgi:hypothetical protein
MMIIPVTVPVTVSVVPEIDPVKLAVEPSPPTTTPVAVVCRVVVGTAGALIVYDARLVVIFGVTAVFEALTVKLFPIKVVPFVTVITPTFGSVPLSDAMETPVIVGVMLHTTGAARVSVFVKVNVVLSAERVSIVAGEAVPAVNDGGAGVLMLKLLRVLDTLMAAFDA